MNNEFKSDNIMWAEYLDSIDSLPELLKQMQRVQDAFDVWQAKTDWVQETCTPQEIGMHRADVLKARIEALNAGRSRAALQPLTSDEIRAIAKAGGWDGSYQSIKFARAIEQAHGIGVQDE